MSRPYRYDAVGNIMHMAHHAGATIDQPGQVLWNRRYQYALDSNRLLATSIPGDPDNLPDYAACRPATATTTATILHGNMTRMPHLPMMQWDFRDQLQALRASRSPDDGTPETTYYVYDAARAAQCAR